MREYTDRIWDMGQSDLEKRLIGKRVVEINENNSEMTLDDGTVLVFQDESDCCAWFEAELKAGNLTDNAVTAVRVTDRQENEYGDEDYTLHILAADETIADLNITGNPTSGYYCHSITLEIIGPKEEE